MPPPATLTTKQARFIDEYLVDSNGAAAAVRAGYAPGSAKVAASRMLAKDNPVRRAIQARQDADSQRLGVGRDFVIKGIRAAIDQARLQSNPSAMIAGYGLLAKMFGMFAPIAQKVEVSTGGYSVLKQMQLLTDQDLEELIQQGRASGL